MKRYVVAIFAMVLVLCISVFAKDDKMTANEVIEKHIASIGTRDALKANADRDMTGTAVAKPLVGGAGELQGPVLLMAQAPDKFRLMMQFNSTTYPSDEYFFNGQKLSISNIRPGYHSRLGEFLYQREVILKDGLLGGTLSSAWALLDVNSRKAKLTYDGIKKVDGRDLHQITYMPKKNADQLVIKIYFEPETFRHVLTTYAFTTRAEFSSVITENAGMREHHYRLEEMFSDFRQMNGLTLPAKYSFKYSDDWDARQPVTNSVVSSSSKENSAMWLYEITLDQFNRAAIPAAAPGAAQ